MSKKDIAKAINVDLSTIYRELAPIKVLLTIILSPGHKVGNMESVGIVKISNKKTRHNSHRQYVPPMAKIILKKSTEVFTPHARYI